MSQCNREELTQQPQRDLSVESQTEDPQKQPGRKKQPHSEMHGVRQIALRHEALEQRISLLFARRGDIFVV